MGFPSNLSVTDLNGAWNAVKADAALIKSSARNVRNSSAAGPISADMVIDLAQRISEAVGRLNLATQVVGLQDFARTQINNPTLDLAATYNAMITQANSTVSWIRTNLPKDVNGYLLYLTLDVSGNRQIRTFTTAETAGLRTVLDALIATID